MSEIRFIASVPPGLPAGLYSVRVGQRLQSGALDASFGAVAGADDLQFDASGPRTKLHPEAVVARFPVPGSSGHLAGALAHVVLSDPSLPWLRRPWALAGGDPAASWLALILIGGAELDTLGRRTSTVGDLSQARSQPLEPGERADAMVNLVSLPPDLAARVLPTPDELPFLCHVRETDGPGPSTGASTGSSTGSSSHAVVVANRLPRSGGHNEVHLVSLEGVASATPAGQPVELISLDHWQFDSVDGGPEFRDLAIAVAHNCGPLRQETAVAATDDQLRRGVVAMPYRGSVAWYRGPLAPSTDDPAVAAVGKAFDKRLPVTAEELLVFDEQLQMVDATYAVAWDLGRTLTIADGHAALAVDAYWRARRHWAHAEGAMQGLVGHRQSEPKPSPDMIAWFESLFDLSAVPSRYLLPDPDRLIPRTEARWDSSGASRHAAGRLGFFAVDPVWVTVMAFGAASVGLVTAEERAQLAKVDLHGPALCGFALRSELVGWDDLQIRVWAGPATTEPPLRAVERDLGADLRLILVESDAAWLTVELSRAPHGLHFGIEEISSPMRKYPRDAAGVVGTLAAVDVPERPNADGTIAIADLATSLVAGDAAAFARHMVLGCPSLQLELELRAAP